MPNSSYANLAPKTFYQRWSWAVVGATLLLVPLVFYRAGVAVQNNVNRVEDWLPKSFEETKHLAWFRHHFASDQFVIVSWQNCHLDVGRGTSEGSGDGAQPATPGDDPRLAQLARLLVPQEKAGVGSPPSPSDSVSPQHEVSPADDAARRKYFKSVVTGRDLLNRLTGPPLNLPLQTAIDRLQGTMIGPDGKQTCLVVTLHAAALGELKKVLGTGQNRIFRADVPPGVLRRLIAQAGVAAGDLHLGGPPVDNSAIDEEGERTLVRLAGLSGLLGLGLAWWSLRSVALTLIVFFCGVLSAAASLAIVGMAGQNIDAILMSMPSLVYVLAISGAVHLVNYYREAIKTGGLYASAERAVQHAWKPALLCSITTAVGLLSLGASELVPIRKFGIFSAAGVMTLVGIVYFFLPAALHLSGIGQRWLNQSQAAARGTGNAITNARKKRAKVLCGEGSGQLSPAILSQSGHSPQEEYPGYENIWERIAAGIVAHYRLVGTTCVLVTAVVGMGVGFSSSSIDLLKLFDSRARILQDYRWLEAHLGKLVPLEIVVRFPVTTQREVGPTGVGEDNWAELSFVQRLETITRMQALIDRKFGPAGTDVVGNSLSAASFAPSLPSATSGNYGFIQRKAIDARLSRSKPELCEAGFLRVDPQDGSELWRVSLRVAAFRDVDYGQFVKELQQITQPLLAAYHARARVLSELARLTPINSPAGKRVLIWSYSRQPPAEEPAEQTFPLVLHGLLQEYRCNVRLLTDDPRTTPLTELESLDKLDAVVVCGDFSDADLAVVKASIPDTIDARLLSTEAGLQPVAIAGTKLHQTATASAAVGDQYVEEQEQDQELSAVYTGVVPIVYQAQRALLNSLVESTWWSFLTITPIMMIVSRSIFAGAVAMIPNAIPVLLIFGGMGWFDIPIDIGSMMTASIALGVAVDDTIHFLARYREELQRTTDRQRAIVLTYGHCAVPTLQAALISGLGLSVFAFSTFTPTQRFGWLMLCILMAGVVSELVLLPALLASPLGKVFSGSKVRRQPLANESVSEQPLVHATAHRRPAA